MDAQGDPLPEGAAARIGTTRFNHGNLVQAVAYSPDGSVLASAGGAVIRLWDPSTGREIRQLGPGPGAANHPTFSPDGRTLAVAVGDGRGERLILFDVATGRECARSDPYKASFDAMAFAPDGRILAAAGVGSEAVILWDAGTLKEAGRIKAHPGGTQAFAFTPDGRSLATVGDDRPPTRVAGRSLQELLGSAAFFDVASGRERRRVPLGDKLAAAATFSRDGRRLASEP